MPSVRDVGAASVRCRCSRGWESQVTRARSWVTMTCLGLVALLTPVALVASWVEGTITDSDRYVATVAPLATDEEVVAAVERRLTERAVAAVEDRRLLDRAATALEKEGVPPALAEVLTLLADPLGSRLDQAVGRVVRRVVHDPAFAEAWANANEVAHQELVAVLEGESDLLELGREGTVSISVATLTNAVRQGLVDAGVPGAERLPEVEASFPLGRVADLERARVAYAWLDRAGGALPWVVAGLLAVAVATAKDRRRALARGALAVVGGALVVVVLLAVGRQVFLHALPVDTSVGVAASVFEAVVAPLRSSLRLTALGALAVLVPAVLLGRSRVALSVRSSAARAWAWTGTAADSLPWMRALAGLVAVLGVVVVVSAGNLGPAVTFVIAAVVALATTLAVRPG